MPRKFFAQWFPATLTAVRALRLTCGAGALEQDVPLVVGEQTPPIRPRRTSSQLPVAYTSTDWSPSVGT
ncbi:hypothetical protein [Rhodococcus jostii]|uniref:hypothetical protein n=1 Tax=Rhodococcus jostii TaxID=132919 RepID=UPI0011D06ECF|nr:hypothetical protein [Rhodococcus jostii]